MKKFWVSVKESWFIWVAFVVFFVLVGSMAAFSADWNRSFPLDYGPPGDTRTEMLNKLDEQADETFVHLNTLKANFASTTAPTSPSQGQVWYDTLNSTLKVFEASTWISAYSYSSAEFTWLGEIASNAAVSTTQLNAVSATIDNLEASTISSLYATITDIDVVSAEIGSATITTLTSVIFDVSVATIGTLNVTTWDGLALNGVLLADSAGTDIPSTSGVTLSWDTETYDTNDYHVAGTPGRITVSSGIDFVSFTVGIFASTLGDIGNTITPVSLTIFKNGGGFIYCNSTDTLIDLASVGGNISAFSCASPAVAVTANDYFTVSLTHAHTSTVTVTTSSFFGMEVVE